jgi:hypothetical protein
MLLTTASCLTLLGCALGCAAGFRQWHSRRRATSLRRGEPSAILYLLVLGMAGAGFALVVVSTHM